MSKQGVGRYFIFIKNKVSSDWKDLAWCLGFETPDIENIKGKEPDDKSRCMELLQQWYKREGNAATIHVLKEALKDAQLQHVVDSLKGEYPEVDESPKSPPSSFESLTDLPVHLYLGAVQPPTTAGGQAGDIDARVSERLLELERTLFTEDVLKDRRRYKKTREIFLSHKALLKDSFPGSILLLLTFLRQTDVDGFYHNHYRVGEGTLSQQLSHILISDDLQDKVKGAQLIVRLQVKHEDYVRVRDRLGQGLHRTTSVNNLLAMPPPSRQVDHSSSLKGLDLAVIGREDRDLAVIGREDRPCTDGADDITVQYRQVQSAVRTTREKSKQKVKVQLEMMQGQVQSGKQGVDTMMKEVEMLKAKNEKAEKILLQQTTEMNKKMQKLQETNKSMETAMEQLQETNKNMEARIEALLTAKQPVKSGSQQKYPRVGQPWVEKVSFGGNGYRRGEFRGPCGVAVSQDNEVYIADRGNHRIQVFTMDGVYIREFTTLPAGEIDEKIWRSGMPWDVAVDRNDNLWVVSKSRVVQYSKEGTCLATKDLPFIDDADIRWFRGITVSMATEQVIVTEYDGQNGQLRVFNQDGSEVGIYGAGHRSPNPWWPRYVTVDGEGNILVTDSNNHCVHVWDRKGNFKFKFGSEGSDQLNNPEGICVDGKGNIIVADKGNHCVKKDSHGRFLSYIGSGLKDPQAVAMSPGGDVVVTDDKTKTVSVWTQG